MKTVCNENMCTGCMACVNVCAKNAVVVQDDLTAYNAVIDSNKCVSCGLCHGICPQCNAVDFQTPILWKQGWATDNEERSKSSSGGFATEIAKSFVRENGVVCSCLLESGEFQFGFAKTEAECEKFRGSKYIKSNPKKTYRKIKEYLKLGQRVLFIGLPCQVAGLKNFVGTRMQENLYTIDLICHGTPSPKLLEKYLYQDFSLNISDLQELSFRAKTKFNVYESGKKIVPARVQDRYTMAFLQGLDYTQNCYSCQYARVERVSDITLGDSWGSSLEKEEIQKGISLALCQSQKGRELLQNARLALYDVEQEAAVRANRQLRAPSSVPQERNVFFEKLMKTDNFNKAVSAAYPKQCIKQDIKVVLYRLKILGGVNNTPYVISYKIK